MKNNFNDSGVKVDYVEEVDVANLKANNYKYGFYKSKIMYVVLLILLILFIIAVLFSGIFGLVYSNKTIEESETIKYTLLITHSNDYYGAQNISFDKYLSLENSYDYYFKISNQNSIVLNYKIQIENTNYGYDNIDQSKIKYSLLSNNAVISNGNFIDKQTFDLLSTSIPNNTTQEYILKVWSDNIDKDLKYSFKVNISV